MSSPSSPPSFWSSLSIYSRAGIVIACLLAFLFLFSTTTVCIVRRGRFSNTDPSARKPWYWRSPLAAGVVISEKEDTAVEVEDEESGYVARRGCSGFGSTVPGIEVTAPQEEEEQEEEGDGALREYERRGGEAGSYGYAYGYPHAYRDGDADGYARETSREREHRTWNAV